MAITYFNNKLFTIVKKVNDRTKRHFKALVILYGSNDFGKTSILKNFITKKSGCTIPVNSNDVRCHFQSNNHTFCVCTGGDDRMTVEMNCISFDIVATNPGAPLICISAARIGQGSSSVSDVLDYYSRKIRTNCYITLWINVEELLATTAKQAGILGYDNSNDLKHQRINNQLIDKLTDEACKLLDKQIQEIEKL